MTNKIVKKSGRKNVFACIGIAAVSIFTVAAMVATHRTSQNR